MKSRMNEIVAFLEVAEQLNFAKAASNLKITPSTLSRNIKSLEAYASALLFYRTTRTVVLTEAGEILYHYCMKGMAEIEKAENELAFITAAPRGVLKVCAPICFGQLHVTPYLHAFMTKYPEVTIELMLTNDDIGQVESSTDIVFKIGSLNDSNLIARKLATNTQYLVASPSYIEKYGNPESPDELDSHNCFSTDNQFQSSTWAFVKDGLVAKVKANGNFRSNNALSIYASALKGSGIALLPAYIAQPNIYNKNLIQVLPDWEVEPSAIYAMYVQSKNIAPKIRAFLEYFIETFSPVPPWYMDQERGVK